MKVLPNLLIEPLSVLFRIEAEKHLVSGDEDRPADQTWLANHQVYQFIVGQLATMVTVWFSTRTPPGKHFVNR